MRVVLLTNIVSPHQMPLAQELVARLGDDNFRYVAIEKEHPGRIELGWLNGPVPPWVLTAGHSAEGDAEVRNWCDHADVLISGLRQFELFRRRAQLGLINLYMSERWFKPPLGFARVFVPWYFQLCREIYRLVRDGHLRLLPIGVQAVRDMARMLGLLHGDLRCLFSAPPVAFPERQPLAKVTGCFGCDAMRLWGYFVEPSDRPVCESSNSGASHLVKILWCGRMLDWKRADTVVQAVKLLLDQGEAITLRLTGYGPEEQRSRSMAGPWLRTDGKDETVPGIVFQPPVKISGIRALMRDSDVVVLSSNGGEGWGAVVNEAMAEGCCVIGTHEAGSSATMIEHGVNGWLYPAGDAEQLAECLRKEIRRIEAGQPNRRGVAAARTLAEVWSPAAAAQALWREIEP